MHPTGAKSERLYKDWRQEIHLSACKQDGVKEAFESVRGFVFPNFVPALAATIGNAEWSVGPSMPCISSHNSPAAPAWHTTPAMPAMVQNSSYAGNPTPFQLRIPHNFSCAAPANSTQLQPRIPHNSSRANHPTQLQPRRHSPHTTPATPAVERARLLPKLPAAAAAKFAAVCFM